MGIKLMQQVRAKTCLSVSLFCKVEDMRVGLEGLHFALLKTNLFRNFPEKGTLLKGVIAIDE